MNKEKPYIYKRVIAYFIDMLLITFISVILVNYVVKNENYMESSNKLMNLINQTVSGNISQEEYNSQYNNLSYEMNKESVDVTIIMCAVSVVYYVIIAYCADGQTLGKKLMRIKIVSNNGKNLHINNYLIRSLLINNILLDIISSALIIFLSKANYITYYSKVSSVFSLFLMTTLVLMFFSNNGRGLHDIIANTKIVNVKKDEIEVTNEIKEAEYVELPNTIQLENPDEVEEKEEKKNSKKKNKKINENPEGVSESERI